MANCDPVAADERPAATHPAAALTDGPPGSSSQSDLQMLTILDEVIGLAPKDQATLPTERVDTLAQHAKVDDADTGRAVDGDRPLRVRSVRSDIEVIGTLAEGGMGRVALARQRSLRREIAVKMLKGGRTSRVLVASLLHEAIVCGSLEHPNIVPVHALQIDEDAQPLLLMKRVEGVTWTTLIDSPQHPAWACVAGSRDDRLGAHLSILLSVCNAVGYAHSRGILHCDIKPHNVMVGSFGEVYLVDWGLALRLSEGCAVLPPGRPLGTPGFLAPEMASDGERRLGPLTDVFLLGATLHYALTGQCRHLGRSAVQQILQAQQVRPFAYDAAVPSELAAICNRATAADPTQRFQSPADLAAALSDFLRHRGAIALSDAAQGRLAQAQQSLAAAKGAAVRRVHELLTECQFGFQQSLRAWPENAQAKAGLEQCLSVMLRIELQQQNVLRAQALLAQLQQPSAEQRAAVKQLEDQQEQRRSRDAQLSEFERQHDWSTAASPRALFILLGFVAAIVTWRLALQIRPPAQQPMPAGQMALFLGIGVAGVLALVGLFRRYLFQTRVTQLLIFGSLCALLGMFLNRCLFLIPVNAAATTVATDMLIAATACAVGAVTLGRPLWSAVPALLGASITARLYPQLAGEAMAAGIGGGLLFVVSLLSRPRGSGYLR